MVAKVMIDDPPRPELVRIWAPHRVWQKPGLIPLTTTPHKRPGGSKRSKNSIIQNFAYLPAPADDVHLCGSVRGSDSAVAKKLSPINSSGRTTAPPICAVPPLLQSTIAGVPFHPDCGLAPDIVRLPVVPAQTSPTFIRSLRQRAALCQNRLLLGVCLSNPG
jgi:hypothetical protein